MKKYKILLKKVGIILELQFVNFLRIKYFLKNKIKYNKIENIENLIKNKKQAIFICIHQSNWEVLVPV